MRGLDEGEDTNQFILSTTIEGLSLVPATRDLSGAEIELIAVPERERRLSVFLARMRPQFDFVIIDSPPSLGLLTLNALVASDRVLIPLHCEYFALEGLADLVVDDAPRARVPQPGPRHRRRAAHDERRAHEPRPAGRRATCASSSRRRSTGTVIPRNVRLAEAPSHGLPAVTYDARSRGAEAYFAFASEVLARNEARNANNE